MSAFLNLILLTLESDNSVLYMVSWSLSEGLAACVYILVWGSDLEMLRWWVDEWADEIATLRIVWTRSRLLPISIQGIN